MDLISATIFGRATSLLEACLNSRPKAESGKRKSVGRWDPNSPRFHSRRSTLTPPPPLRNRSPVPVSPPNAEPIWLPTVQSSSTPPSPIRALCSWAANPCPVPVCPFRNPPSAFRFQLSTPRPLPLFPPLASRLSTLDSRLSRPKSPANRPLSGYNFLPHRQLPALRRRET